MTNLKPWYQVVVPREDLRENRPLDASEFAVHLDHIREQRAHQDYLNPERFFARTYLTQSLLDLTSQVVRRLSGIKVETSAVFNMATQFGGGKTHSLTALYHLATGGKAAQNWNGVQGILMRAQINTIPQAAVAVFVGTEFDVITGRSGEGEPRRKTPWGEIAWQLGREQTFAAVAQHDEQGIAPAGEVLRKMLPDGPTVILMDELLNYVSRARRIGLSSQFYDFLHNLSEEARARDNLVLCISIPASELEMQPEDQRDYDSYKKLLDRVGKAISMSSDNEVTEIIRRRLFDWSGTMPQEGTKVVAEYSNWVRDHATELANLGGESPEELFLSCYPFHPTLISVFQRKWQSLPRFQRTRGILRLLALWIARAYQEEHRKNSREPLITIGSAPLADQNFRDALFEQLGSDQLSIPVATDIIGKQNAHAVRLDREAINAIKESRLHQRVATTIFFESNGGQSQNRTEASVSDIRAAVGNSEINLADMETVLEGLTANCFYLHWEGKRYRFGLRPNLNQMLVNRRGAVKDKDIDARIQQTTLELFKVGSKSVERRYFPEKSNDVPDRPQLSLVVLGLKYPAPQPTTKSFIENILRECGTTGRTYKSGLIFIAPDNDAAIIEATRNVLAWEDIEADADTVKQLEEAQRRSLNQSLGRVKGDLKESIWRAYRHVFLLGKDNTVKSLDLGQITSSMAPSLCDLVINTLVRDDEITNMVGHNKLVRLWPPALTEWSTKAVRDAFFASPALPRLLDPNSIKRTIAEGVTDKLFGYASRDATGKLQLDRFGESLLEKDVEISNDFFILRAEDAQRLLEPARIEPSSIDLNHGEHVTVKVDNVQVETGVRVVAINEHQTQNQDDNEYQTENKIQWSGTIPYRKWMNFYSKVISKLVSFPGLKLQVSLECPVQGAEALSKIEEIKNALSEFEIKQ